MNKRVTKEIKIIYSNIQGFTGKKESIQEIIERSNCDICLLTETMTVNVKLSGMKCITSKKSVGQNVAIILRGQMAGNVPMKLYDPNEVINMLGIRLEVAKNNYQRFYTAHMKQVSINDKETIRNQFEEIKGQFRQASISKEPMLLICDANVHVGDGIRGCKDKQDWAGLEFLQMIECEGLYLVNREDVCEGVVTRIDPRNGTKSTLDLVVCNEFAINDVKEMIIDEDEELKPKRYAGKKITKTDHNTIMVKIKVKKKESPKQQAYYNTRCEIGRVKFQDEINNIEDFDGLFNNIEMINDDYGKLMRLWNEVIDKSFKKVRRSTKSIQGVDEEIKELIREERIVKKEWKSGQEKDKKLEAIRSEISWKIAENVEESMITKMKEVTASKCPQAEVFKVRRNVAKTEIVDFPLKDENGNIRVTREGIDEVISNHFQKVFKQNNIKDGWEEYWEYVIKIYEIISRNEASKERMNGPTYEEITEIIDKLDKSKAVRGTMSIDLIKRTGENFRKMIHRCVRMCYMEKRMPEEFRIEKMILLYKHKGKLDELDNYRGIFLRLVIVTIYQKWLYSKCSPIVDENGSDSAFGGRKGKDTLEPLLIIKLVQDHAKWTKEQYIFKFMDVEKFFDSMNFHRCMIDLHRSGIKGGYWKAYESINEHKTCVPVIPSGPCSKIGVKDVFVQGSSDAVLMAWNHMDSLNKKERDVWSKSCIVQGVELDALTFVDDILELIKTKLDLILSSARSEIFQDETRLKFKPPKCKIMIMNQIEEICDEINGMILEIVDDHEYLGTIISNDGTRNVEIDRRIKEAQSVLNEIVLILKTTELAKVRLKYVGMLSNACLDSKVEYGCGVWSKLKSTQEKEINALKMKLIKRVLELPYSTPSSVVKYEFGITDLDLDCYMEKIVLAYNIINKNGLGKKLLCTMMEKNVPGFCVELREALEIMNVNEDDEILRKDGKEIRKELKKQIVKIQKERLVEKMLGESKADRVLLNNFKFDGKVKKYLTELPFEEARVVFMLRSRMFPTKDNFKGRWGIECDFCHENETDVHLFSCVAYNDLLRDVEYDMFMTLDRSMEELSIGARRLLLVKDRLENINVSQAKKVSE